MAKPDTPPKQVIFEGEEAGAGFASPLMDFIASAFLLLIAAAFMAGSLALPVPGSLATAPGLLPFLTAASLGLMALALAWTAWQRWRASRLLATRMAPFDWDLPTELRTADPDLPHRFRAGWISPCAQRLRTGHNCRAGGHHEPLLARAPMDQPDDLHCLDRLPVACFPEHVSCSTARIVNHRNA